MGRANEWVKTKRRPRRAVTPPGPAGHSPALIGLSLVGLLASRARRRFARHTQYTATMREKDRCILVVLRLWMELSNFVHRRAYQDATEDYPQSGRTFQVLCVRKSQMGGGFVSANAGGGGTRPQERSGDLLRLRSAGAGFDRLPERRFEFVPLWGIPVLFVYALRRVRIARLAG